VREAFSAEPSSRSKSTISICVPSQFHAAVKIAADRELLSVSAFARRVLSDRLKVDGIDPQSPVSGGCRAAEARP
jgi:predicted HicB family RNase H-like nuclease